MGVIDQVDVRVYSKPLEFEGPSLKFTLTYHGELRATQRDAEDGQRNPLAMAKHSIRRCFHYQLKRLTQTYPAFSDDMVIPEYYLGEDWEHSDIAPEWHEDPKKKRNLYEVRGWQNRRFGYRFSPIMDPSLKVVCNLNIVLLRRDYPGSVIQAGDIDNRIKTLIDALRMPYSQNELVGDDRTPRGGETPFFCLMIDDNQVNGLSVRADTLLDPATDNDNSDRMAKVYIEVEVKPYLATISNLSLF